MNNELPGMTITSGCPHTCAVAMSQHSVKTAFCRAVHNISAYFQQLLVVLLLLHVIYPSMVHNTARKDGK